MYWDQFTPKEWEKRTGEITAERERQHKLEQATVAFAQPGEMQAKRDFNDQDEESEPDCVMGRAGRRGTRWFSFDLPVDRAHLTALVVTYYIDEWHQRTFRVLVDGQGESESRFFAAEYKLPTELVADKKKVTTRFEATNGNEIATVFGLRTVRADAER